MTGPEHWREAERLIAEATHWDRVPGSDPVHLVACAQVHATLALTAPALGLDDSDNWPVTP